MRINQHIYYYYINRKINKNSIFKEFTYTLDVIDIHQLINHNTYLDYTPFDDNCEILMLLQNKHRIYQYLFDHIKRVEIEKFKKNRRYYNYKKYLKKLQDKYLNSLK